MSRKCHLLSAARTASARQSDRSSPGQLKELEAVRVCFESCLGAALPASNAELDAIELLLGPELKLFTT